MRFSNSCASLAIGASLVAVVSGQGEGHREIYYAPNVSIAERLLPTDQDVVVLRPLDYPIVHPEPGPLNVLHELMDGRYGTAVLMDVRSVRGTLVEDGRWIETVLEGSVAETLSLAVADGRTRSPLAKGADLKASMDGGSVMIGKVRVRTTDNVPFPPNRRYLVFLGPYPDPDTGHLRLGSDPLLVNGNKLTPVEGSKTKLTGLTLDDVKRLARRNKK